MFDNYFLTNKFEDKLCTKDENFVYAVATKPDENTEKLTIFTLLGNMQNKNECFVKVDTKTKYQDDFGKTSTLSNVEYLKFERFYESNAIFCTHFTEVNGLDGKPHFMPLPSSCLLRADEKSTSPLGVDFVRINNYIFANKVDGFKFCDYHRINPTPELREDNSWTETQSK